MTLTRYLHKFLTFAALICACNLHAAPAPDGAMEIVGTAIAPATENLSAMRDRYGFLWVGTTSGLSCFDGNGVPVYRNYAGTIPATSAFSVRSLMELDDDIWMGTRVGIQIYHRNNNSVERFKRKTGYRVQIGASVVRIFNAGSGRVWICTLGQGFFIYNSADSTMVQDSRHGTFFSDMTAGPNGDLYLASLSGEIQIFRPSGRHVTTRSLPGYQADKNSISIEASGPYVWVASGSMLYKLDSRTLEVMPVEVNPAMGVINALHALGTGQLLLGTDSGVWVQSPGQEGFTRAAMDASALAVAPDQRVTGIFADNHEEEVMLIHPTGALGLLLTRTSPFTFKPLESADRTASIHAILPHVNGTGLWAGSDAGLHFYDFGTGSLAARPLAAVGNDAITSLTFNDTKLWIGTKHRGLVTYDTASGATRSYVYDEKTPYSIVSNEITDVNCTRGGDTYVLTNWGTCSYNHINDNFPQLTEFGQQTAGRAMQEDANGVWLATSETGLYYKAKEWTRFEKMVQYEQMERMLIIKMYLDHTGRLWVLTQNNGLWVFDKTASDFVPVDMPLLNHQPILFLCEDDRGRMWVGTSRMLVSIDPDGNTGFLDFGRFSTLQPELEAVTRVPDGRIAIGCRGGILLFDPGLIKSLNEVVRVYPTGLEFPNLPPDSDAPKGLSFLHEKIEIPYTHNTFVVHVAVNHSLGFPEVLCDYMLSGVDKDWNLGTSVPDITYKNLPPGDYTLHMRPHGVKDAPITTLIISVLPPWYRTVWAMIAYAAIVGLALFWFWHLTRKRMRRNLQRRVEDIEMQKEREVFEAKTRYFVNLVHEIRTPLMLISLPLEQLATRLRSRAEKGAETPQVAADIECTDSMQRNLDYLLNVTNQILDFRKAEKNSELQLALSNVSFTRMLTDICSRFEEPMAIEGKHIELLLPDDEVMATIDTNKTERMIMNLLGNAMKYSRRNVTVILDASIPGSVKLTIADDGPGIPPKEREKIFDSYYQIGNDNVAASLGTGLGLAYAKLIAEAHHGSITVTDNPGGGARFTILLPGAEWADMADTEAPNRRWEAAATAQPAETVEDAAEGTAADPAAPTAEKRPTVLLVEDNNELRRMMSGALSANYNVLTAADGVEGLETLTAHNEEVDVIVSDVMMPRMDGMELCRRVKGNIASSHIPFIILTAKTDPESHQEGMEGGADVYLEKPFPIRQLTYQIANLLRTRKLFYEHMRATVGTAAATLAPAPHSAADAKSGTATPGTLNRVDAEFLERMNGIITELISSEDFSIDLLAERLNMSRSSFYRKITSVVGMSPNDYLKNFRLNHAAELLCEGCRVTEVAERVGFTSSSYFTKCFREKFGVLPSEYPAKK